MKKMILPLLIAAVTIGCGHTTPPTDPTTVDTPIAKPATVTVVKTDTVLPKPKFKKPKVKKDTSAGALPYKTKYNQNFDNSGKPLYK